MDDPKAAPVFVALDRVRLCYREYTDVTWMGRFRRRAVTRSKEPDLAALPALFVSSLGQSSNP